MLLKLMPAVSKKKKMEKKPSQMTGVEIGINGLLKKSSPDLGRYKTNVIRQILKKVYFSFLKYLTENTLNFV